MVEQQGVVDAKTKKYDRQLRIWGAHGQAALERTRICLLGAGPTGAETLKNLVLGGIAQFTIVDGARVTPRDLGNNWLVEAGALGRPRAQAVTEGLKELNEAVMGTYVDEEPAALLAADPGFFASFDLVIATQLSEATALDLDSTCRQAGVTLLLARAYGLVGYLRASLPEHLVVESKPDNSVDDLRLHKPWPELKKWAMSFDVPNLDDITHKHVPYVALLIQAADRWFADHSDKPPANSKERASFQLLLKAGQRHVDGVPLEEENFNEALAAAHKMWAPPRIPDEVRAILDDEKTHVTRESNDFWVLAAALRRFVDKEGAGDLPVEGAIPDMTATTALYLEVQRLYREKADRDCADVAAHAASLLQSVGREPKSIPAATIRQFCKNARNLRVVRYRTLAEEVGEASGRGARLRSALAAEDTAANAGLYILLRAVDRFHSTHNRFPGCFGGGDAEEDMPLLKAAASSLLAESGVSGLAIPDDLVAEVCRFGAAELHCVAAVMGGVAAQEAIKLATRQFVPAGGTLLYNAMASTTSVFAF